MVTVATRWGCTGIDGRQAEEKHHESTVSRKQVQPMAEVPRLEANKHAAVHHGKRRTTTMAKDELIYSWRMDYTRRIQP